MDLTQAIAFVSSLPYIGPFATYLPWIVVIGAIIGTFLKAPAPTASSAYKLLYEIVQWCALNKGQATNLTAPSSVGKVGGPTA